MLVCPSPPAGAPSTTWADCSVGLDPTKNGGDLLWAKGTYVGNPQCMNDPAPMQFVVGPTGDIAVGGVCYSLATLHGVSNHLNGSGVGLGSLDLSTGGTGNGWSNLSFDRYKNLVAFFNRYYVGGPSAEVAVVGPSKSTYYGFSSPILPPWNWPPFGAPPQWDTDATGDFFVTVNSSLARENGPNQSIQNSFSGSFIADQVGGIYRYGALANSLDLGCGAMIPASPTSTYLARIDANWSCVYSRVLPDKVAVLGDGAGGVVLSASSNTGLDLGCGFLSAAPGGSTIITHLDGAGSCLAGVSVGAPGLTVALDSSGRILLSGVAGASPVDLGGGPLAPIGTQDIVVGELDAAGNSLWTKRLGAAGLSLSAVSVSTSQAGDVYILLGGLATPIDFGGGPVSGAPVVVSYTPQGVHRWSRGFSIAGGYVPRIDGCGGLVLESTDPNFNPGCTGTLIPPKGFMTPNVAFARFAP